MLFENRLSFWSGFLATPNKKHPKIIPVAKAAKAMGSIAKQNIKILAAVTINILPNILTTGLLKTAYILFLHHVKRNRPCLSPA